MTTYRSPNRPQAPSSQTFVTTLVADTAQTVNVPSTARVAIFTKSTADPLSVSIGVAINTSPSATAGTQVATFDTITGATAIVLDAFAGGFQVVDVGSAITLASPTGVANTSKIRTASVNVDGADTAGFQVVDVGGAKSGGTATGLANDIDTAGIQVVDVGGAKAGGTATGLANDSTVYTATVDVNDAASPQAIAVTGSTAQTYTTLIAELDTDTTGASWSIVAGNLVATSDATGASSAIDIVDTDLFSTLTDFVAVVSPVDGIDETVYTATVDVDDAASPQAISIVGNAAQTYTELLSELNDDTTGATWAIVSGNLRCTSALLGLGSAIDIVNTDLFDTLTDFVAVNAPVDAADDFTISVRGKAMQTYADLISEINNDIGGATASLVGGDLRITSDDTTVSSAIDIEDVDLFADLADFVAVDAAVASVEIDYEMTVAIDGNPPSAISLNSSDFNDFDALVADIEAVVAGDGAEATVAGSTILITSDTTGAGSSIVIVDDNLYSSIAEFLQLEAFVLGNMPQANFTLNPDTLNIEGASTIDIESSGTPVISIAFYG